MTAPRVIALSGGIGGAKLALGLYQVLPEHALMVVCNTGDDFDHLGLRITPDFDTVLYTLAGQANPETGWGRSGESWRFMEALAALGGETWFSLGDQDLATHVFRAQALATGKSLSEICEVLAARFGVKARLLPATDDLLQTIVITVEGPLPFQHYFVRDACRPRVRGFQFSGASTARPAIPFIDALSSADLEAVVICPSNPFISIDPILAVPGIRDALRQTRAPVVAVSPIIAGKAVKGPTAKMLSELGMDVSATSIGQHYRDIIDGYVIDETDKDITNLLTMPVGQTKTLMNSAADKRALAEYVVAFAKSL